MIMKQKIKQILKAKLPPKRVKQLKSILNTNSARSIPKAVTPKVEQRNYLAGMPVLTVKELCSFLEIPVPANLQDKKEKYVDTLSDFEKINDKIKDYTGDKKEILQSKTTEDFYLEAHRNLESRGKIFKNRYMNSKIFKHNSDELFQMALEWYYIFLPLGFVATDFFDFKLYNKTIEKADTFVDFSYKKRIKQACTKAGYGAFCENKPNFNRKFKDFIHRDFLNVAEASFEAFNEFVTKHPKFFAKPIEGKSGRGAGIVDFTGNAEKLYEEFKHDKMLMEELLVQHAEIAQFNPDTINTLRVMTLLPVNDEPLITFAGIRFGRKGMQVDNVSGGGLTAAIDIETGKIKTKAIDKYDVEYEAHPDSQVQFIDFQIPHWDKIVEKVKKLAKHLPEIRSIGWDLAILKNGDIELIEGNRSPHFRTAQISDQIGKKPLYEKYLPEIEKAKYGTNKVDYNIKKVPFLNDRQVFTVNGIFDLLEESVPNYFVPKKDELIYRTALFNKIPNSQELLSTSRRKEIYTNIEYREVKASALEFKNFYSKLLEMPQRRSDVARFFIHWFYVYSPTGISVAEYFNRKLYLKAEHVDKILRIKNNRVFTLEEIGNLLEIEVPVGKDDLVTETEYFKNLENHKKLLAQVELGDDLSVRYYEKITKQAKRFKTKFKETNLIAEKNNEVLLRHFVNYLYVFFPLNFYGCEYFDFKLYEKSIEEAKTFVDWSYKNKIIRVCNKGAWELCQDKAIFNKIAHKYVNRDYLDSRTCTYEEFVEFIGKHPKFFVKPFGGNQGRGAAILEYHDNAKELFDYCKNHEVMIEELVHQHSDISKINASTVNTIRILTLLPLDNKPIVTFAGIRVGRAGNIVDNTSAGGMMAAIDLKTGRIFTNAVDAYGNEFATHPDSGTTFKGLQIPNWSGVLSAVKETALEFPQLRHIGWDVAITDRGEIEFIEGNPRPHFRGVQFVDQIGKKHLYEKYVNEIEQWRKEQEA